MTIEYTGPSFRDSSLITMDEIQSGEVNVPEGKEPYTVKHGDNLTKIAREHGYGNPPDMSAFYKDNPQYNNRNPNLIYPGEVVIVNKKEGQPTDKTVDDKDKTGTTEGKDFKPGEPPKNGAQQTSAADQYGTATFQNYKDGKPDGAPYQAGVGKHAQPANAYTYDENGNSIRTDKQGKPANGYVVVDGDSRGNLKWVRYENGQPTEDVIRTSPNDKPQREVDPETGALKTGWTKLENDKYIYHKDGVAQGEPISSDEKPSYPPNSKSINAQGKEIYTDAKGEPKNGRYLERQDNGTNEVAYKDGVITSVSKLPPNMCVTDPDGFPVNTDDKGNVKPGTYERVEQAPPPLDGENVYKRTYDYNGNVISTKGPEFRPR